MDSPSDPQWDVIVIGAGMGGGMAARSLAEAGLRVLILEKGRAAPRRDEAGINTTVADPVARAVRGLWPTRVEARVEGRVTHEFAPLGMGVGGSSAFYAATLERPERHDLEPTPEMAHPTGGWPVSFDDLGPWFDRAEDLLSVTRDAPLSPAEARLESMMTEAGLRPYRLPQAVRRVDGCKNCLGKRCPMPCKMDGRSAGIEPALATGNATLWTDAEVTGLRGGTGKVTGVDVERSGARHRVTARAYVLAAGALASPHILLHSNDWAQGAANRSGWVGRGLMFHLNEMLALWPPGRGDRLESGKSLGFRDLYHMDGQRMGAVQALGVHAGFPEILHFLRTRLARHRWGRWKPVQEGARLPALIAARLLGTAHIHVGLLEDLPQYENRVRRASEVGQISFEYRLTDELRQRRQVFRKAIRRRLRHARPIFLNRDPQPNFGHPSGTLRMGRDPGASVVDAWSRCHDLANLRVADASVFPTSMGVNPSLTIAALALRMADDLAKELKGDKAHET